MDKEKKIALEHKLLQRVSDAFNEQDFPSVIETYTVQDKEVELARVMLRDPETGEEEEIAEYYFLETEMSAPDVLYFTGITTIYHDIEVEHFYDVMRAATIMNANLPFGAYVVNTDAALLMFRVDGLLNTEHGEDVAFDQASIVAAHTLQMSNRFSSIMIEVCEGKCPPEELRRALNI